MVNYEPPYYLHRFAKLTATNFDYIAALHNVASEKRLMLAGVRDAALVKW